MCWKHVKKKLQEAGYFSNVLSFQDFGCLLNSRYGYNRVHVRPVISLIHRLKLNAFKTKFSNNGQCICGDRITVFHILFNCRQLKQYLPLIEENSLEKVLLNAPLMCDIALSLMHSPIGSLL